MHDFKINIQIQTRYQNKELESLLRQIALTTLSNFFQIQRNTLSIDIIISNDTLLHNLNQEFMGEDSTTDVLAFPAKSSKSDPSYSVNSQIQLLSPDNNHIYLGEVYLSYPQAKKQAKQHHHSLDHEITSLIVHGILHILGFDHINIKENFEMEQATKFLLNQIINKG